MVFNKNGIYVRVVKEEYNSKLTKEEKVIEFKNTNNETMRIRVPVAKVWVGRSVVKEMIRKGLPECSADDKIEITMYLRGCKECNGVYIKQQEFKYGASKYS